MDKDSQYFEYKVQLYTTDGHGKFFIGDAVPYQATSAESAAEAAVGTPVSEMGQIHLLAAKVSCIVDGQLQVKLFYRMEE